MAFNLFKFQVNDLGVGTWKSVHDATYGVLKSLLADNLAAAFNWAGINRSKKSEDQSTLQKKAFRATRSRGLVFGE